MVKQFYLIIPNNLIVNGSCNFEVEQIPTTASLIVGNDNLVTLTVANLSSGNVDRIMFNVIAIDN